MIFKRSSGGNDVYTYTIAISLLIHIFLFFIVPKSKVEIEPDKFIEVELTPPPKVEEQPLIPSIAESGPKPAAPQNNVPPKKVTKKQPPPPPKPKKASKPAAQKATPSPPQTGKTVSKPILDDPFAIASGTPTNRGVPTVDSTKRAELPSEKPQVRDNEQFIAQSEKDEVSAPIASNEAADGDYSTQRQLFQAQQNLSSSGSSSGNGSGSGNGESGWGNRKIIFKPVPPKISLDNTSPVTFKVNVLPTGQVSQVIPLRKGNATLERQGIEYIKKFKFNSVQTSQIQIGTIELIVKAGKIIHE